MSIIDSPNFSSMRTPLIVDVDTGIDDALALLYLSRSTNVDLRAVTCVAGNTTIEQVLENTRAVLDIARASEHVPVAAGADRPLINPARTAHGFHGSNGIGGLLLPPPKHGTDPRSATTLMRDVVEASDAPVTLLALGPLTNVAMFVRLFPKTAAKLARIVFMGGAVSSGNATAVAEFNAWHDPEALDIVLRSDVETTMFGLEVFAETVLDESSIPALRAANSAWAELTADLLDVYRVAGGQLSLGDAGAACYAVRPSLGVTERLPVHVELTGTTRGQTVVDRRGFDGEAELHLMGVAATSCEVVSRIHVAGIEAEFLTTLVAPHER